MSLELGDVLLSELSSLVETMLHDRLMDLVVETSNPTITVRVMSLGRAYDYAPMIQYSVRVELIHEGFQPLIIHVYGFESNHGDELPPASHMVDQLLVRVEKRFRKIIKQGG